MRGRYRAEVGGPHVVGVAGVGVLSLAINGAVLAEATTLHPSEVVEAFSRPPELRVPIELAAGDEVDIQAAYRPNVRGPEAGFVTMRLGVTPQLEEDRLLDEAVAARGCGRRGGGCRRVDRGYRERGVRPRHPAPPGPRGQAGAARRGCTTEDGGGCELGDAGADAVGG